MDPYEAQYRRRSRSSVGLFEVGEAALIEPNSVHYAMDKIQLIRDTFKTTKVVKTLMQM